MPGLDFALMRIGVPKERAPRERRVAITPQVALRLVEERLAVAVEAGAGTAATFADEEYRDAGAEIVECDEAVQSDVVVVIGPPPLELAGAVPEGSVLIGFLEPFTSPDLVRLLAGRNISSFAMEAIPRTTLAQSMDALSSQATAAGYQAVLTAASALPRLRHRCARARARRRVGLPAVRRQRRSACR